VYILSHNAKMTMQYKDEPSSRYIWLPFSYIFHTFLIHFQYPLQFEIEANASPIIYAKY
jgi:hypothetical protein